MKKLTIFLAGGVLGLIAKTVIAKVERPSIEDIIAAHRGQSDDLGSDGTDSETEPGDASSERQNHQRAP